MESRYPIRLVFHRSLAGYLEHNHVSSQQLKVANAISNCKTGSLGCNVSECEECGHREVHSCSCRNRHCPNCQTLSKEVWIDQRRSEMLDAKYFHAVFTVPAHLNALFLANQQLLYALLFRAASDTLLTLSQDKRYLGATPGIIIVLHTWGQNLAYHPHVHCIVSEAGISKDNKLVKRGSSFFIPIKAAMKMFRGKFLAALKEYKADGRLNIPDSAADLSIPEGWQAFIDTLYSSDWVAYIKETFNGAGNAINYLGRYTHRVAISNSRIIDVSDDEVSFRYRDYRDGKSKVMALTHEEFIRRFLLHVLPKGFQKIRYYGYLANSVRSRQLAILFRQQGYQSFSRKFSKDIPMDEVIQETLGVDLRICPCCGKASMRFAGSHFSLRR